MTEHRDPRPRLAKPTPAGNLIPARRAPMLQARPGKRGPARPSLRRRADAALMATEGDLAELRHLITRAAAAIYAVGDLVAKRVQGDEADERDPATIEAHLWAILDVTRDAITEAADAGREAADEVANRRAELRGRP